MSLIARELSSPELMFPLPPNSCKDEKDGLSMCFLACQCFVPGLEPLIIYLSIRKTEMCDSEERMCSYNDTRLTALKLKSLFYILGTVQGAAKGAPAFVLTPVLPGGTGE